MGEKKAEERELRGKISIQLSVCVGEREKRRQLVAERRGESERERDGDMSIYIPFVRMGNK